MLHLWSGQSQGVDLLRVLNQLGSNVSRKCGFEEPRADPLAASAAMTPTLRDVSCHQAMFYEENVTFVKTETVMKWEKKKKGRVREEFS